MVPKHDDTLGCYLNQMSRYPLLSAEDEVFYSQQVQKYVKLEEFKRSLFLKLKREATNLELAIFLDVNESEVLFFTEFIEKKGRKAKEWMVVTNLRLVVTIAKKYQGKGLEFLDLIQEGTLGLQKAVEKFDPSKKNRFSTYAYWWIVQGITRAISDKARLIRLPVHIIETISKIRRTRESLHYSLGRSPTLLEIAESSGLKVEKIEKCLELVEIPLSLDMKVGMAGGKREGLGLIEFMESEELSAEEQVDFELLKEDVNKLLGFLANKQRKVLMLRFGLSDDHSDREKLTLAQISDRLDCSPERIRQLQLNAMDILRAKNQEVGAVRSHISG